MAADAFGHVCGGRQFFAQWLGEPLHGAGMPLRQHPSPSTGGGLGGPLPAPGWEGRRGGRGGRAEAPRQQGHCGQALTTRGGKDQLPPGPQHLRGPQGEPLDGPAVSIHRLRRRPRGAGAAYAARRGGDSGGAWMTTQVNVGAPGFASGRTQLSPPCAAILQGAAGGPPCQVARRAGGVAACVRPVSGRGRGRPRGPVVGRRPGPRSAGSEARRACSGGSRADRPRDSWPRGAAPVGPPWSGPAGFVRGEGGAAVVVTAGGGTALSPGASASAGRHRQGLASRGGPTAPRRAARPTERAGRAWPAWAQEGLVGHLCKRGRQQPTRSQASGGEWRPYARTYAYES